MTNTFNNYGTNITAPQVVQLRKIMFWSFLGFCFLLFLRDAAAVDLAALLLDATNPLNLTLKSIDGLTGGMKAIALLVGFLVCLLALALLKQFGIVVMYFGVAIFAAVGLGLALKIAGSVI